MIERVQIIAKPKTIPVDAAICVGNVPDDLIKAIFGTDCQIKFLPDNIDMADVLVSIGVFPSKSQARKNWKGTLEIPRGSHFVPNPNVDSEGNMRLNGIGKKQTTLFIHRTTH